jgi:hypothetical protein
MRFWPFGREKEEKPDTVDYVSQVVSASTRGGASLRGKMIVHFVAEVPELAAQEAMDRCLQAFKARIAREAMAIDVIGLEAEVAAQILAEYPASALPLRSLEIVALHVIGDDPAPAKAYDRPRPTSSRPAPSSSRPAPPSSRPAPPSAALLIEEDPLALVPSSLPLSAPSSLPISSSVPVSSRRASQPEVSIRRPSSGQMLSVRSSRLVAIGAPIESAASALSPIFRDIALRFVLGVLRTYDLVVLKRLEIHAGDTDALSALIPSAEAAPGRFEQSRGDEFSRWELALGVSKLAELRREGMTLSFFLLHRELIHLGVEIGAATRLLESLAEKLSERESLAQLPRYLVLPDGHAASALSDVIRKLIPFESTDPAKLPMLLTPLLMYVQDELDLIARQVRESQPT